MRLLNHCKLEHVYIIRYTYTHTLVTMYLDASRKLKHCTIAQPDASTNLPNPTSERPKQPPLLYYHHPAPIHIHERRTDSLFPTWRFPCLIDAFCIQWQNVIVYLMVPNSKDVSFRATWWNPIVSHQQKLIHKQWWILTHRNTPLITKSPHNIVTK